MTPNSCYLKREQDTVLTADQQRVCTQLLSLALVRASTTEAALPVGVLPRWSVPLLVGPAGSGKAYVCEEVARRWGKRPCRRWEVGSWITTSNRSSETTLEQIHAFIASNPTGAVVYLAGMDSLGVKAEHNASYAVAVTGEITQLLDGASARPARFTGHYSNTIQANVLVVVGGCFAAMWGDAAIDGPSGGEAWRLADGDPLAGPDAITKWLLEYSRLPADILRRLSPEPLILHRIDPEQAQRLAVRLCDNLPPSLDGLRVEEFRDALQSPHGWRAVAALIERAWVDGHETLLVPQAEATDPTPLAPPSEPAKPDSVTPPSSVRLGERLGIPSSRSRLVAHARRLGLHTTWDMERLVIARGFLLPGENTSGTVFTEGVTSVVFSDTELTALLLSPCLPMNARAICRGALLLAAQLVVPPESLVYEVRRARGETVVRHVAWLGCEVYPQDRRWRDLLRMLPSVRVTPAFPPGIMPDDAIRRALTLP